MYRDTEWSYQGWTCDTYRSERYDVWVCDIRFPGIELHDQTFRAAKKVEAERQAKEYMDSYTQESVR